MATLADSLISTSSRPISLRMRPDLVARRQRYHGRTYWVVKEPVGLNYFRFHEEEYAILCMLDGFASLDSIKEQFEREFTPQKITLQDLQQFVGMLHRSGLVVSNAVGQGRQLAKRRGEKKRKELLGKFTNVFALRWRGVDPERVLNWLYPFTAWFFKPVTVTINMLIGLAALLLVIIQFDVFRSRLPSFHEFFGNWQNWIVMAVAMAIAKVLHELGHGLSCKHFRGECHEIGFMLLVFTPALYCNVSDSWMLPNKWHRAFIGAAGMYVEIVLASLATFIWWFTNPTSMINQVCLSLMFICSVSTLLFNGNPLLRFDGYYILMDIIEIPNLRQKSSEVLKRFVVQLCLGIEQPENPFLPENHRFFFGLYTVAAVIYRWIVVFSILMFLNRVLEPVGLKIVGQLLGAVGLFGLVVQPTWQMIRFFYVPGRMHKVKRHRVLITVAVVGAALLGVMFIPVPYHVDCSFQVKPRDASSVYAAVPGRLVEVLVEPGVQVEEGQLLARMENVDLKLVVMQLEAQVASTWQEVQNLERQQRFDPTAASRVPETLEQHASLSRQLEEARQELARLEVRAPTAGTVLPAPDRGNPPSAGGQLPSWTGSPLQQKNLGAMLEASDRICQIGDPQRVVAELLIDQAYVELVEEGQPVELMLDSLPGRVFDSEVEELMLRNLDTSPVQLSSQAGGDLDSVTDPATGQPRPLSTTYPALADLEIDGSQLQLGMRGRAKIHTGWQPLGKQLYRFVARVFHFEM